MERSHNDPEHIDLTQERDVKYWKETFGISEEELKKAVRATGSRVRDIRTYLENHSYLKNQGDRGGRARETPDRRLPRS